MILYFDPVPMFPCDIAIEIPVPCEENENGDIQQLIAQTQNDQGTLDGTPIQNDQGTLDGTPNYDNDYDDQEEIPPDCYIEEQNAHPQNNIGFQLGVNYFDQDIVTMPIQIYPNDKILACDTQRGWTRPYPDDMPLQGPFTARQGLNIDMATKKPEDFFNLMFDDHMFETMADETNKYARNRIAHITNGRNFIEQMDDPSNRRYNRLYKWKDVNALDIKLYMAHVIVMSLVQKSAGQELHYYTLLSLENIYHTISSKPYFGIYTSMT